MPSEVETMFSVREVPWHGKGIVLSDYPQSIEEALKAAGLDWKVEKVPLYYGEGNKLTTKQVPGLVATCRSTDKQFFGIVSPKYRILDNIEAFSFVNNLLNHNVKLDTAGALGNGERVWVSTILEPYQILGDEIANYLLFSTSHNGEFSVRVSSTNIRTVCQNTLNLALANAIRTWKAKHLFKETISTRLLDATEALRLNNIYKKALTEYAEAAVQIKYTPDGIQKFVDSLFPITPAQEESKVAKEHIQFQRDSLLSRMDVDDLQNFKGTQWGIIQAVADYAYHFEGVRKRKNSYETKMGYVFDGSKLLDRAVELLSA